MSDEKYYQYVVDELANNILDHALMAKATVLTEGDEEKARFEYIKLRVSKLKSDNLKLKTVNTAATAAAFGAELVQKTPFKKIFLKTVVFLLRALAVIIAITVLMTEFLPGLGGWGDKTYLRYFYIGGMIVLWIIAESINNRST